jgi:hypothetical protein
MVQLSATRCSWIAILWASLVNFVAINLCAASQRVFIVVSVYFIIDSVRKLLDTLSYIWTLYHIFERFISYPDIIILYCILVTVHEYNLVLSIVISVPTFLLPSDKTVCVWSIQKTTHNMRLHYRENFKSRIKCASVQNVLLLFLSLDFVGLFICQIM